MRRATSALGLALAASLAGCGDDPVPAAAGTAAVSAYAGTLAADIRGAIEVRIDLGAGRATTVDLRWGSDATLATLGGATGITGAGTREGLPEGNAELYTAKLSLPADPAGLCGAEPVALALSLVRSGSNRRAAGSLTAYCGDRHFGVPARIYRLSGELPPVP